MIRAGKGSTRDPWGDVTKLSGVFPRGKVLVFKLFCMLGIFHNYQVKKKKGAGRKKGRNGMQQKEDGIWGSGCWLQLCPQTTL